MIQTIICLTSKQTLLQWTSVPVFSVFNLTRQQLRVLVNILWAMYVKGIKGEKVHVCQEHSIQLVDVTFFLLSTLSIDADKTCVL